MKGFAWLAMAVVILIGGVHASDNKGTEVTLDGLKSAAPADWKAGTPSNKFRAYQFSIPKASGDTEDGELVIFFFGTGSGGSADDNIKRWKGMFRPPQGKTIEDVSKVENFKFNNIDMVYLDVHGTYVFKNPPFAPNAVEERHPGYQMLGVYFGSEKGPYFIRMTGPEKTVQQQKKNFDDWLKAFK